MKFAVVVVISLIVGAVVCDRQGDAPNSWPLFRVVAEPSTNGHDPVTVMMGAISAMLKQKSFPHKQTNECEAALGLRANFNDADNGTVFVLTDSYPRMWYGLSSGSKLQTAFEKVAVSACEKNSSGYVAFDLAFVCVVFPKKSTWNTLNTVQLPVILNSYVQRDMVHVAETYASSITTPNGTVIPQLTQFITSIDTSLTFTPQQFPNVAQFQGLRARMFEVKAFYDVVNALSNFWFPNGSVVNSATAKSNERRKCDFGIGVLCDQLGNSVAVVTDAKLEVQTNFKIGPDRISSLGCTIELPSLTFTVTCASPSMIYASPYTYSLFPHFDTTVPVAALVNGRYMNKLIKSMPKMSPQQLRDQFGLYSVQSTTFYPQNSMNQVTITPPRRLTLQTSGAAHIEPPAPSTQRSPLFSGGIVVVLVGVAATTLVTVGASVWRFRVRRQRSVDGKYEEIISQI